MNEKYAQVDLVEHNTSIFNLLHELVKWSYILGNKNNSQLGSISQSSVSTRYTIAIILGYLKKHSFGIAKLYIVMSTTDYKNNYQKGWQDCHQNRWQIPRPKANIDSRRLYIHRNFTRNTTYPLILKYIQQSISKAYATLNHSKGVGMFHCKYTNLKYILQSICNYLPGRYIYSIVPVKLRNSMTRRQMNSIIQGIESVSNS